MAHTYESLKKMTLAQLRDVAKDVQHDAVQGFTQMNLDTCRPCARRSASTRTSITPRTAISSS